MKRRIIGAMFVVGMLIFSLAGCGAKTTGAGTTSGPTTVHITLTDFKIVSSLTTFTVGTTYHFVVVNNGAVQHELMAMPVAKGTAGETERDAAKLFEVANIDPGTTKSGDYTFTATSVPGILELACHVAGHYESNMRLAISVH